MSKFVERSMQRRADIFNYVRWHIIELGYPPTRRDICGYLKITSTSAVNWHLVGLQDEGKLQLVPKIARGIVLVEE